MDVLCGSQFALSILGFEFEAEPDVATLDTKKPLTRLKKLLSKVLVSVYALVMLVSCLISPYLAYLSKKADMKLLLSIFTLWFGLTVVVIMMTVKNLPLAVETLSDVIVELPQKDRNHLRRNDIISITLRLAIVVCQEVGAMAYLLLNPTEERNIFYNGAYNQSMMAMSLHLCGFFTCLLVMTVLSQYFIAVITIGKLYAIHVRNIVSQIHERHVCSMKSKTMKSRLLLGVKRNLEKYYSFVRHINDWLGYIPLAMFAFLFCNFVYSMTAVSLNNNLSFGFTFLVFGLTIAYQLYTVNQAIYVATDATKVIGEAVNVASSLTTEPCREDTPFDVIESRRSLTVFLEQQTIVPFTAQSIFTLEPKVLLSFANAVVPFTVMIITTVSSMRGGSHTRVSTSI